MPSSTVPHNIYMPLSADNVKQAGPAKLASDIAAVAQTTNNALTLVEGRALAAARESELSSALHAKSLDAQNRTDWESADTATLSESIKYTDASFAASGPGGATDAQVDAAVSRGVLSGRVADGEKMPEFGARAVGKGELVTNVADYAWLGDGRVAIQAAINAAKGGSTVFIPAGIWESSSTEWVETEKSLTLLGEPGTIIKGIRFYIHGSAEVLRPVEVGAQAGDKNVRVSAHGLSANEYVQLFSEYNVYTADAGRFQMGSVNPTTGLLWTCRATEIQKVGYVSTPDQIRTLSALRYNYGSNIQNIQQPMAGVASAEIRKLNMVENFTFKNIRFDLSEVTGATPILFRFAASPRFDNCSWDCAGPVGGYVQATDTYDFQFVNSWMCHPIQGAPAGSGQNAILIGAGCTEVTFDDSSFYGGAQIIDSITNTLASGGQPGAQGEVIRSELATVQDVRISDCRFYDCADAFTSHPATYGVDVFDNIIVGGSQGIHTRSRNTVITGNTIRTSLTGISTSAFTSNTVIEGNTIEQLPSLVERPFAWAGIRYTPTSTEIINGNNVQSYRIRNNTIIASDTTTGHVGVRLYHSLTAYEGLTDAIKRSLSDISIRGNEFTRCGIQVEQWVNGVQSVNNSFNGGAYKAHYVDVATDAALPTISGNEFHLEPATGGFAVRPVQGSYGYNPGAVVGDNTYFGAGPANITAAIIVAARNSGGSSDTQSGILNITASGDAVGTVKTVTVTFPRPFLEPPVVVAVSQAGSSVVKYVNNATTTSVQIVSEKVSASGFNAPGHWIAVGRVA